MAEGENFHTCIVNVGLFRSGTTTLARAAETIGLKAKRTFPNLSDEQLKGFLLKPEQTIQKWHSSIGYGNFIEMAAQHDIVCDGWVALFPFLPHKVMEDLQKDAKASGTVLRFVATAREVERTVQSELQHWVIHDLEERCGLDFEQRSCLEGMLRKRAVQHQEAVQRLQAMGRLSILLLNDEITETWPDVLAKKSNINRAQWASALQTVGKANANPPLPVEGILLTLRVGSGTEADKKIASIDSLLNAIEVDSLCRYLVVLSVDADEEQSRGTKQLIERVKSRVSSNAQLLSLDVLTNPPRSNNKPFPICSVWNSMAMVAWEKGADWVLLLGDDIDIECRFHFRAIYRSFVGIADRLKVPFGFGCPWWNDKTFPGFPTFPCVGKSHFQIFGSLIPKHRQSSFVNQDLDPYLHQLYQKYRASPCLSEVALWNRNGGNMFAIDVQSSNQARYQRVEAIGWREFCETDRHPIRDFLPAKTTPSLLVDVIVPSYRVRLDYLGSICSLKVPSYFETLFIIIVDNPEELRLTASTILESHGDTTSLGHAERILEDYLSQLSGNRVRVRCNATNVGASASRNRGLDESAAEYVLHLDDDLIPAPDLLEQYGRKLQQLDSRTVGLVGLVRFPRSPTLPLSHAAILMSYLTFMFEIAESDIYPSPAWGVTANILFRRTSVRFDLVYAKTGGGEDVDYSLSVTRTFPGGQLLAVPDAKVVHPFWPGSTWTLAGHFLNWAIGDGSLFGRFPEYTYGSYPNVSETLCLLTPFLFWFGVMKMCEMIFLLLLADFLVDVSNVEEFRHRSMLVDGKHDSSPRRSWCFYVAAHMLANVYIIILEFGRLYGHFSRQELAKNMFRRFDWHCGKLPKAPRNFKRQEARKFGLFLAIIAYELGCLIATRPFPDGMVSNYMVVEYV